jgi:predicted HTH transcriptional regulator
VTPRNGWLTEALVTTLLGLDRECPWCEFKQNNVDPEKLGDTLAALSNGARLSDQAFGYLVFGVADDLTAVGTDVRIEAERSGAQPLLEKLSRELTPRPMLSVAEAVVRGHRITAIRIPAATGQPCAFNGRERIRVGSRNQSLRDYADHSRTLWSKLTSARFEERILSGPHTAQEVAERLDLEAYAKLRGLSPVDGETVYRTLVRDGMIQMQDDGRALISALGAILLARQLTKFPEIERRAVRVIEHPGLGRTELGFKENVGSRGYAAGFRGLLSFVIERIPAKESIVGGVRQAETVYPEVALREFIANALMHQDFEMDGSGPMIEIFSDRVEITNPGVPLNDPDRLLDLPPQSPNEKLALGMRRLGLCEERGSGIDRAVEAIELEQLPAPEILVVGDHTRVTLLGPRPLSQMTQLDRLRACYQHACLLWISSQAMTNASFRRRLGISDRDYSMASRIIAEALEAEVIRPFDPDNRSRKHAKYVPIWAR